MTQSGGAGRAGKIIVLLADGTGNSSGKLAKTNVWRLYQALELEPVALGSGQVQQIAYYHDGVGTSAFRPLAYLGGVFGWGLKRNILDLYKFVCRNYEPGDRIYAFGFSRGAFTIRTLIGLLLREGLLPGGSSVELSRLSRKLYRNYRRTFPSTPLLARIMRCLRDLLLAGKCLGRRPEPLGCETAPVGRIEFVGVWDTVAAYGMPLAELTRGIDRWLFRLSLQNYRLSPLVAKARHALSLDDERDTFHPLLWDEVNEATLVEKGEVAPGRLKQVWFAGMHSDVGGGYPDDALAYVPLDWMMEEAHLRYKPGSVRDIKQAVSLSAPKHDSRRGLGGYYRYQPRKLSAFLDPPDPTTLIMRNPDLQGHGLLTSVKIHESVIARITAGPDGYAPIVLPGVYDVVQAGGALVPSSAAQIARAVAQERVWNLVWWKRFFYFLTVAASIALVIVPARLPAAACEGPQCLLSPLISLAGVFVPSFATSWIESYAQYPHWLLLMVGIVWLFLSCSSGLEASIDDRMRKLWLPSLATPPGALPGLPTNVIYRLRSSPAYQRALQNLKWSTVPGIFVWLLLAVGALVIAVAVDRAGIAWDERWNGFCEPATVQSSGSTTAEFATSDVCGATGISVTRDRLYRISLTVKQPWQDDGAIDTSPQGFGLDKLPWYERYITFLFRRSLFDRWFQPLMKIVPSEDNALLTAWKSDTRPLEMQRADTSTPTYVAQFAATRSGTLYLFVNDAVIPFDRSIAGYFYRNNRGTASVKVEEVR